MIIRKYNQFILERNNIELTNEGMKDWVAAFMMLVGVGVVPVSVSTADAKTKKDFVESQPQDKLDAAKFVDYINKLGTTDPIDKIWLDFIKNNSDVKSNINDVKKYINKDGKSYHFDKKYQEQDFTNIDIHKFSPANYLTDMGNFIDDSLEPKINNFIYEYQKQTSVEICIVTVPSLNDEDPFQYSLDQFNRIGVGKNSTDNGILIMVSMKDRKWEIRTGYGVEGLLPDISCSHIGNSILKPHFKDGDYYGGIMGALQEIKLKIDKNPEDIKKFIKVERELKSVKLYDDLEVLGLTLFTMITALLLVRLVYNKWNSAKEMSEEVSEKMKGIEKMKNSLSKSGITEVDDLYNKFKKIIDENILILGSLSKHEDKPKFYQIGKHADFLLNQKKRIKSLEGIYDDIEKAYSNWEGKKLRLDSLKSLISNYNIKDIISSIDSGFQAWNKLKDEYGVNLTYDKELLNTKSSELKPIVDKAEETYKTSISSAENIISDFSEKRGSIFTSINNVKSKLVTYESAEAKLKSWKKLIDASLSYMNNFKQWGTSSEKSDIESLVNKFSGEFDISNKLNILENAKNLDKLIGIIDDMGEKWKRRKDEEEEEEERRRRKKREEEEESRRSSYSSSSSSSSSFDGFGGGSSGGGGAGGDW